MAADLVIVTHNTWLIPFGAPWMLGRVERVGAHQRATVQRLREDAAEDALIVVAAQELWAFRAGIGWPVLWLMKLLQAALLGANIVPGRRESFPMRLVSGFALVLGALWCWLPLPLGLWNPKRRVARALAQAGAPHAIGMTSSLSPMLVLSLIHI